MIDILIINDIYILFFLGNSMKKLILLSLLIISNNATAVRSNKGMQINEYRKNIGNNYNKLEKFSNKKFKPTSYIIDFSKNPQGCIIQTLLIFTVLSSLTPHTYAHSLNTTSKSCPNNFCNADLVCPEIEEYTGIQTNICKLIAPSFKELWPPICTNMSSIISNSKKPPMIFLGENHLEEIGPAILSYKIMEHFENNNKNNIVFFREFIPNSSDNDQPLYHAWLEKEGVKLIDADIKTSEDHMFLMKCGITSLEREKGFIETIANQDNIETGLAVFGAAHISAFAANPYINQNFQPIFIQLDNPPIFAVAADCPSKYQQRHKISKTLNPTFSTLKLSITAIIPGTEKTLFDYLISGDINLSLLSKKAASDLFKIFFKKNELNIAKKALWFKNLAESNGLSKHVTNKSDWYLNFITLLTAQKILNTYPDSFTSIEQIIKISNINHNFFVKMLSFNDQLIIQNIQYGIDLE